MPFEKQFYAMCGTKLSGHILAGFSICGALAQVRHFFAQRG